MSQWQQERRGNVGMMGQQAGNQQRLLYSFNLEEHVPADHLLRGIDRFLDLSALRQPLAPFYIHTGRPSIDPETQRATAKRSRSTHSDRGHELHHKNELLNPGHLRKFQTR